MTYGEGLLSPRSAWHMVDAHLSSHSWVLNKPILPSRCFFLSLCLFEQVDYILQKRKGEETGIVFAVEIL